MRPDGKKLTLFHDHDPRDELQNFGFHRMRDEKHRPPFDEVAQALVNQQFALRGRGLKGLLPHLEQHKHRLIALRKKY